MVFMNSHQKLMGCFWNLFLSYFFYYSCKYYLIFKVASVVFTYGVVFACRKWTSTIREKETDRLTPVSIASISELSMFKMGLTKSLYGAWYFVGIRLLKPLLQVIWDLTTPRYSSTSPWLVYSRFHVDHVDIWSVSYITFSA